MKEITTVDVCQKPFLKWAGGKTQMIGELMKYVPFEYNKYIEAFIGGGALYFALGPSRPIISDLNEDLTITYLAVKENVEEVISILEGFENTEEFYYSIRALDTKTLTNLERAARLIFLNKTCFNGLYRVNKKGEFNVPYGKRTGEFLNRDLLRSANCALQNTVILNANYLTVLQSYAEAGDFVFLDPPYYPVSKYSDFQRYTKEFFYHDDQIALKNEFDRLVNLGCWVVLTNSDHPFVLELYKDYEIKTIQTKRLISSNPSTRTGTDIIVIGKQ
jgi:DNA adenine methylase Dam